MKKKKSIFLCMPGTFGFSNSIIYNLNIEGYEVYKCIIGDEKYKYKNVFERLINCYRKVFFKDYNYKKSLQLQQRYATIYNQVDNLPEVDYALFIRPDLFPIEFINKAKLKSKKTIGYQWDGLSRFPKIQEYIDLFDNFFVFDHTDIHSDKKVLPSTNFTMEDIGDYVSPKNNIYFLASYDEHRFELMNKLRKTLNKTDFYQDINFITNEIEILKKLEKYNYPIQENINYQQNLINAKQSTILIDLVNPIHAGLSFRIFEALNYDKKLITNNSSVGLYDFYNSNNIFIWDESSTEKDLLNFLSLPVQPVAPEIKYKYSFSNWIKYILEDGEFIPIKLPA